ncbi:pyruvate kinase-like protein [Aspergillus bertholletiae]|uniref:Pyruvate kinase-like protein n=1 Tax=Aspergillus bertholletiae TaxID=1226010 RepID=A0A5N7B4E8_9EURO|nr:pyruvate kinase-like protein [Aspergillus bertholletiae]
MSVKSVSLSASHSVSKTAVPSITLVPNHGVQGDAHAGPTVQHRPLRNVRPSDVNLRQVHLMHAEILQQVSKDPVTAVKDISLMPGQLGENITTQGIDLLSLPKDTKLLFVDSKAPRQNAPTLRLTGLRSPGPQLDAIKKGLKDRFLVKDSRGVVVGYMAGVMSVVEKGGEIRPGMEIMIQKPATNLALNCI